MELQRAFGGWHAPVARLLAATDPAALLHHPLQDLHPVAPMRFGRRTALVGDAAHAMTPNLGQGACQALEDAVTLAGLVPDGGCGTAAEVEAALQRYDAERRPRVALVARRSWQIGRVAGARGAITSAAVRALARLTPSSATTRGAERIAAWTTPYPSPLSPRWSPSPSPAGAASEVTPESGRAGQALGGQPAGRVRSGR